jgi:small-conductance mechanosensitive channel
LIIAYFRHLSLNSALSPWVIGPALCVIWIVILLSVKSRVLRLIQRRLDGRRHWVWADSLIYALAPAVTLIIFASGLSLLQQILPLNAHADHLFGIVLTAATVFALFIFANRGSRRLLSHAAGSSPTLSGAQGLLQGGVSGVLIALAVLIFMSTVGISITPILASLGIGSLAVALALQDTLANLFAGIFMITEKPIAAGNFIKLESGEQGYVSKVGWRCTHIRMLGDSEVVVPNAKLASSVITNFSLPQEQLSVTMEIGVHYDSDLPEVERITLEVAREVMATVDGALRGFDPRLRFHTFGDSSINFNLWLGANSYRASLLVKHELVKRLHARYRAEGIVVPYPIRTLDLPAGLALPAGIAADAGKLSLSSSDHLLNPASEASGSDNARDSSADTNSRPHNGR